MKVAIVHHWLIKMGGGEKVVEYLCDLYPEADIDSAVKDYDHVIIDDAYQYYHARDWTPFLKYKNVTIMRTFSKAFGLAGLRIGYIAGELVDLLNGLAGEGAAAFKEANPEAQSKYFKNIKNDKFVIAKSIFLDAAT